MNCGIEKKGEVGGFQIEIIENPSGLPKKEQEVLVKELNSISVDAFNKATPIEETWERTVGVDCIFLIKEKEKIVGYATNDVMEISGKKVNYFSSALFRREIQSKGLYHEINKIRRDHIEGMDFLMTRTQNPMVYSGFKRLCEEGDREIFPNGKDTPDDVMGIAKGYSSIVNKHMVCEGVYGRALMDDTPLPNAGSASVFSHVNMSRGDGMILIGARKQNEYIIDNQMME